ncbi:hypothetical protein BDV27DRAFT_51879 [Aspergillus caelatus]|uniref:Uncharacterized protein n=1 Tax=Aspergillus caelatus TaxID=61420 RepID=A0A5N7AEE9_9EURO|nr:uncharacterized protein BDV27DRAFT_51879 [Aspergillus caelatus]KAE8368247.1 hypothetical protein BDV27DRAFT_51879 [Aspergillus caelatus]
MFIMVLGDKISGHINRLNSPLRQWRLCMNRCKTSQTTCSSSSQPVSQPLLLISGGNLVAYEWIMETCTPLAASMVFLVLQSFGSSIACSWFSNLILGTKPGQARGGIGSNEYGTLLDRIW